MRLQVGIQAKLRCLVHKADLPCVIHLVELVTWLIAPLDDGINSYNYYHNGETKKKVLFVPVVVH